MLETVSIPFGNGINNKARSESVPEGFCRVATNVDFDNAGNGRLRKGRTLVISGSAPHSLWKRHYSDSDAFYVEGGDLKYLDADNSASTVITGLGDERLSYTTAAGRVFFSNLAHTGSYISGSYQNWGVSRPPRQPDASESTGGDMYAGTYKIAITWLRNGEESGTGNSNTLDIVSGSGIRLTNFPVPPSDITKVAVYVSSVNGKELYLYDEYSANVSEVFINRVINTIPLRTQFGRRPTGFSIIEAHYGRIYGARGRYIFYSNAQNYGLFMPRQRLPFPDEVTAIISVPGTLYIGTRKAVYRIDNIDGQGAPVRTQVKDYGIVKMRNTAYDTDNEVAYFLSTKGYCAASSEGITEITAKNVAMDEYDEVSLSVVEQDGFKRLVGVSQGIAKTSTLKASDL